MQKAREKFLKAALGTDNVKIHSLKGDASDRLYFRIFQESKSFILMQMKEPFLSFLPFLSVQKHFQKNKVNVPQIHFHKEDLGIMLLEDLGDVTLEQFFLKKNQPNILKLYQKAIDQLINIHYHAANDKSDCSAFQIIFDTEKMTQEMTYCQKHFLENYLQISLTDKDKKKLNKEFIHLCSLLDQDQKCIVHRDYHSRNIMIILDQVKIIDFQDARMALCQYDLVSLLKDAYANIDKSMEDFLIEDYLTKSSAFKKNTSKDEFMELYHLHSIQRCFKAIGSFASFYNLKKESGYLKYIPKSVQNVLDSLSHFTQYPMLKTILTDHNFIRSHLKNT